MSNLCENGKNAKNDLKWKVGERIDQPEKSVFAAGMEAHVRLHEKKDYTDIEP